MVPPSPQYTKPEVERGERFSLTPKLINLRAFAILSETIELKHGSNILSYATQIDLIPTKSSLLYISCATYAFSLYILSILTQTIELFTDEETATNNNETDSLTSSWFNPKASLSTTHRTVNGPLLLQPVPTNANITFLEQIAILHELSLPNRKL